MWISFFNGNGVGDVVMLTNGNGNRSNMINETKKNVTVIKDDKLDEVVAVNLFGVSQELGIQDQVGALKLDDNQAKYINQIITDAGFEFALDIDLSDKFVVGHVEECVPHEDSNHLFVTQTNIGDETVQIVCGAQNITKNLNVLVAKPGAMMPSGMMIWPGELRGVKSEGMICSTAELGLEQIENYPGIWELKSEFEPGTPLEKVIEAYD